MINYYQPFLLPFLRTTPYTLPHHLKRYYYFSWEDGLWDLLEKKNVPRGSTILIPNFYCIDVVENIKNHGYHPVFYTLDNFFQIEHKQFRAIVEKEQPSVIFVFHACGLTSNLFKETAWMSSANNETIIIEDCVHRLVDPDDIQLLHPNHVVMDSLRKDSPLPGSFMYASPEFLSFDQGGRILTWYFLSSSVLYIYFRFVLTLSAILHISRLTSYAHTHILKAHDDIIGDSTKPHKGLFWIPWVHRFIHFKKVKNLKKKQVKYYIQRLPQSAIPESYYSITIPEEEYQHLHVYPLGINLPAETCKKLEASLHAKGIIVWCKFPDAPWSKDKAVLFLPLGFHIQKKDINYICQEILSFQHSL